VTSGHAPAFIFDSDGSYVWWYDDTSDACGARMSYDGNYIWIASGNVPDGMTTDHVHRVTMDGLTDTDFTTAFAHHSHEVTPLPDGSVAFFTYGTGTNGCDDIKIFPTGGTPSSTATTLVNARTAHGGTASCHVNYIQYSPSDDTLIFSDLDNDCLTKVSRTTGATVWVLSGSNGITSTFTGDLWKGGQHGFQILSANDILLFNNNSPSSGGSGSGATALEVMLDTGANTSTKVWSYTASPAIQVMALGDVQRLPNGNTIVNYGPASTIEEVDSGGTVVQEVTSTRTTFGFFEKRATLYGPSTK
jgi:hypothetical protein